MGSDATATPNPTADARCFVDAWQLAGSALDEQRLRALRGLSEVDAARLFARFLHLPLPYPLRESSGLVEQQRVFARMRVKPR